MNYTCRCHCSCLHEHKRDRLFLPASLLDVISVIVDVIMAYTARVFIGRCLRPLKRSCGTGWILQNGYDEVLDAISRALYVDLHDVSSSTILSFGKILSLLTLLLCGIAIIACFLWNEWKQNPTQRSWFLFGGAFYVAGGLKFLWSQVLVAVTESCVLQLSIDRRSSSTLLKRYADDLF